MVVKCYLLSAPKIVLFLCNYLQMAISGGGSIANIQHLPRIFHHLLYLTAILCKLRKLFFFFTLSFILDAAQSPSHFSYSVDDFVWCFEKENPLPSLNILHKLTPNSLICSVWIVCLSMLRITVRKCFDLTSCVVNWPLLHKTQNPPLANFVTFSQTENSLSSGCTFLNSLNHKALLLNFNLLSIRSLFPSQAAAHRKFTNIQPENIQLCLRNNNGIMLLNPEGFKLQRVSKVTMTMIYFYISLTECSCNVTALNKITHHFTITNHMSQTHKSDQCFVYFPG